MGKLLLIRKWQTIKTGNNKNMELARGKGLTAIRWKWY